MYDEAIASVNSEIIGSGYTLVSLQEDTIYGNMKEYRERCGYGSFFYRDYLFLSETDSVHYNVTFQRRALNADAFVPYIDTVSVTCNGSPAGCEIAKRLTIPPTKEAKVFTDGTYSALVIGPPFLAVVGFMVWAAVRNRY
jgi:hypothetical protein